MSHFSKEKKLLLMSVDADVVIFVLVAKQIKLSFCCPVCQLVSEVSGLCVSVVVASDQRRPWLTSICFVCLF